MSGEKKIVVVGSVALATIETPWGAAEDCLGGSASYASVAAGLFAPVGLVAVVGSDLPSTARELFSARGVDTAGLEVVEGRTFRWGGRYHEDMNRRDTLFTGTAPSFCGPTSTRRWRRRSSSRWTRPSWWRWTR